MVRLAENGERKWSMSLPCELGFLIPVAPDNLRYEYSVSNLKASGGSSISAVLVIRARGDNPAERFVINPTRLAEEIVACGGGTYDRQEGSKSQLRFNEDGKEAFRLEDVSYRCAHSNFGCPSSILIRHWAPASNVADSPKVDPNRPQRRCVECGRKGHRKQCCCDEPGNCRIELVWAHTHALDELPPPQKHSRKRPSMRTSAPLKKPRTAADLNCVDSCLCSTLAENLRESNRRLVSVQTAMRALERSLSDVRSGEAMLDDEIQALNNAQGNDATTSAPGPSQNDGLQKRRAAAQNLLRDVTILKEHDLRPSTSVIPQSGAG